MFKNLKITKNMIDITEKRNCCGCGACAQICPKKCITMKSDIEGFLYPVVDKSNCIGCNLCDSVCQYKNKLVAENKPNKAFYFVHGDEKIRDKSSSGGAFYSFAKQIIQENGVVFGAKFNKKWNVEFSSAETLSESEFFMGSKYVQAEIGNIYKDVRKKLMEGRSVLFSGTPCQINGLNMFLKRKYENLLTVDFTCHAVPSPQIWQHYLFTISKGHPDFDYITFRNKRVAGWNDYGITIQNENKVFVSEGNSKNIYMKGFLHYLYCRPSCSNCVSRSFHSNSDIMIGDFWRIEKYHKEKIVNDNKGVSLIISLSEKGSKFVENLAKDGILKEVPICEVEMDKVHDCITKSAPQHPFRKCFFFLDKIGFYLPLNIWLCIEPHRKLLAMARKLYRMIKK